MKYRDGKNIVIGTLLIAVLMMSIGYAAFATQLTLDGNAEITGDWDVKITKIEATETTGDAVPGEPTFTNTTVNFDADLVKPGDSVTYTITVANNGSIDAKLDSAEFTPQADGSPAITYSTTQPATDLPAGETTTFKVTVTYDAGTDDIPEVTTKTISGVVEYVQK